MNEENFALITLMQQFEHNELVIQRLRTRIEHLTRYVDVMARIPHDFFQQLALRREFAATLTRMREFSAAGTVYAPLPRIVASHWIQECDYPVQEEAIDSEVQQTLEPNDYALKEEVVLTEKERIAALLMQEQLRTNNLLSTLRQARSSWHVVKERFAYRLRLLGGHDMQKVYEEYADLKEQLFDLTAVSEMPDAYSMCRRVLGVFL